MQLRGVALVEGTSDRLAVETLARRRGRDLPAEVVDEFETFEGPEWDDP